MHYADAYIKKIINHSYGGHSKVQVASIYVILIGQHKGATRGPSGSYPPLASEAGGPQGTVPLLALGEANMAKGTPFLVQGTPFLAQGAPFIVQGPHSWYMGYFSGSGGTFPGSRCLFPGSVGPFSDSGSPFHGSGHPIHGSKNTF